MRDLPVDRAFIDLLKARDLCLCPTLMRDVSTFVYASRPVFFDDPFFRREADLDTMTRAPDAAASGIESHGRGRKYTRLVSTWPRPTSRSLKDAGIRIAMGTDTGPAGRFQGYFEHLELEHMVAAGLTPMQAVVAATGDAARCMNVADRIGTLKPGLEADFLVLARNPLDDIANTRSLESTWIRSRVPDRTSASLRAQGSRLGKTYDHLLDVLLEP